VNWCNSSCSQMLLQRRQPSAKNATQLRARPPGEEEGEGDDTYRFFQHHCGYAAVSCH